MGPGPGDGLQGGWCHLSVDQSCRPGSAESHREGQGLGQLTETTVGGHAARLAAAIFAVAYGTNVSTPFLVEYRDRLELGPSQTMAIFVVYVAGILGTLVVIGPMSDRLGRRRIVVPFTVLSAIASLVLIPGRDEYLLLLTGRFILGIVSGAVLAIGAAWLQELLGPGRELQAAVVATLMGYLGFGAGPVISAVFDSLDAAPLVAPFVIHAAFTLMTVAALLGVPETHTPSDPAPPFRLAFGVPGAARRGFVRIIVPAALFVFVFPSASFALFPVLISDAVDTSDVIVAAVSGTITAWSGATSRPVLHRIGPRRTLPIAMWSGALGYALGTVAFATDLWGLLLPAAFCTGAASGAITGSCLTLIGEMAEDERRGALTGTFYLLAYPGMAMPLVATALAAVINSTAAALLTVTGLAVAASLWVTRTASEPLVASS